MQALVRGHLVRKQARETLRCMQALVIAQARARVQRARIVSEGKVYQNLSPYRRTTEDNFMYNVSSTEGWFVEILSENFLISIGLFSLR